MNMSFQMYLIRRRRRIRPPVRLDSLEPWPEGDAGRKEIARLSFRPPRPLLSARALLARRGHVVKKGVAGNFSETDALFSVCRDRLKGGP